MEISPQTRQISAAETIDLRWEVLRPGYPRETATFAGDEDAVHLGVYLDEHLAGVASLYDVPPPDGSATERCWQLRGMATSPRARGAGCGEALLLACENTARDAGCESLWCNARRIAVGFYEKHGWEVYSEEFDIPSVGPHFRMRRKL